MRRKVLIDCTKDAKSYKKGCRCFACTEAHNKMCREARGKSSEAKNTKVRWGFRGGF